MQVLSVMDNADCGEAISYPGSTAAFAEVVEEHPYARY
ncbi:hypothetical protein BLSMQ_1339 [Brevibacterium aurantiacum]|uniref:Uncharacterized protein n=1 Tax=Brevibacterium aurantiacum TaxID=273384 RepID=A0A1D7W1T6_BREAU|nr:hypothetical protein BLSMQ_1339 [Brevibacterium aurantiacum]